MKPVNLTPEPALGVFTGSDARGTARLPGFERWLGREVTVGRTYIPGETWAAFLGPDFILRPWTRWRAAKPGRILAINVPMVAPNEGRLSDAAVSVLLNAGAGGAFDLTFKHLARRLVTDNAGDSIIVLGWEMNGTTYSSRCGPDPTAWKAYWRRIVTVMRSVPGQKFRFDFTANRGRDAIPWTDCYPGDDVVDIIGLDHYDQPPFKSFQDYIAQPYGLQHHAQFAAAHGKPMSFPEWGLFRFGDRPDYVRQMLDWIDRHNVVYHSLSDYCPHGVWQCPSNPRSSADFRAAVQRMIPSLPPEVTPDPTSSLTASATPSQSVLSPEPSLSATAVPSADASVTPPATATPELETPTPTVTPTLASASPVRSPDPETSEDVKETIEAIVPKPSKRPTTATPSEPSLAVPSTSVPSTSETSVPSPSVPSPRVPRPSASTAALASERERPSKALPSQAVPSLTVPSVVVPTVPSPIVPSVVPPSIVAPHSGVALPPSITSVATAPSSVFGWIAAIWQNLLSFVVATNTTVQAPVTPEPIPGLAPQPFSVGRQMEE
ncbi:glycoside hydrolase family 26 protein [Nonomuraea soli]|uniref:GH26 domain-containing protein n=1 Tax=Nonomuraea soli TaxID=1032476 RepID=A0A7W0CHZ8_9ACTN|nr:glycosyl hydrolase [Nonomuraea soli]MBA2891404.1 hypothetical protein [Nonomuraea soli]